MYESPNVLNREVWAHKNDPLATGQLPKLNNRPYSGYLDLLKSINLVSNQNASSPPAYLVGSPSRTLVGLGDNNYYDLLGEAAQVESDEMNMPLS